MKIKASVQPQITPLRDVTLNLEPDEAYYLIGLLGATTDEAGKDLYDALTDEVGKNTNQQASTIVLRNPVANKAFNSIRNGRFSGTPNSEPQTITFVYEGLTRVVKDPTFDGNLLKGFELRRGERHTNQFKSYRVEKIGTKTTFRW